VAYIHSCKVCIECDGLSHLGCLEDLQDLISRTGQSKDRQHIASRALGLVDFTGSTLLANARMATPIPLRMFLVHQHPSSEVSTTKYAATCVA